MKNKTSQKAEFVKHIKDKDGEIGELYKVGSEFFVVQWYRDDSERKPCKHNTIFTEVWESNNKGKMGFGRDPIHEWLRWHSGKSIMAQFLKSRACSSPLEILAQNRASLLTRISRDCFGREAELLDECVEEIKLLRAELAAAH